MPYDSRHLIEPTTREQSEKEAAISRQLRETESGVVRGILAKEPTPEGLQAVIENASGFAEAMGQKFRHPDTPPVACTEGCHWCCYQAITVTAPEAFRIARSLKLNFSVESLSILLNKLRALDKQTRGRTPRSREKLRIPCAFLEEMRCSVYPVRPFVCAEFTSFNVHDCKRGQRVGFPANHIHEKARMIAYHAVHKGLFEGLRDTLPEADTTPLELTAAVLCALDTPNAETLWITGEQVFRSAHLNSGSAPGLF